MDIATYIGLTTGLLVITAAVLTGSDFWVFLNLPGFLIVVAGTFAATLIRYPIAGVMTAFVVGAKAAFSGSRESKPRDLVVKALELAEIARKNGMLALENTTIEDPFFSKGIRLCVDSNPPKVVHGMLVKEMEHSIERNEEGERIFRAIGDSAPAFGMIGTLVGLVQMLADLEDPASIGPAMAVALLTTLYGAVIANLVALPIADKLANKIEIERINKSLIIDAVIGIQSGQRVHMLAEILETYLPDNKRGFAADPSESHASTDTNGQENGAKA
ncbi:MotA/TolQ/ExbB proton channel family protein [Thalassospiraceae bacterium LMO-JJ14]|nr:MotA/TolQ/ExbB proton channel family protein [Thalassospiraceae bacterium LMO-JJ14]